MPIAKKKTTKTTTEVAVPSCVASLLFSMWRRASEGRIRERTRDLVDDGQGGQWAVLAHEDKVVATYEPSHRAVRHHKVLKQQAQVALNVAQRLLHSEQETLKRIGDDSPQSEGVKARVKSAEAGLKSAEAEMKKVMCQEPRVGSQVIELPFTSISDVKEVRFCLSTTVSAESAEAE